MESIVKWLRPGAIPVWRQNVRVEKAGRTYVVWPTDEALEEGRQARFTEWGPDGKLGPTWLYIDHRWVKAD